MPRDLDATLAADMAGPSFAPVVLAQFGFRSQTIGAWSGPGPLTWNGMTFLGIGTLGKIGPIGSGTAEVMENAAYVEMSGIDETMLGEALTDCQPNGRVKIWMGSWQNGALHGTPYLLWQGTMGQPQAVPDPGKFTLRLGLQTKMAQLSRPTCRRYTAADQRLYYPDDSAFNCVEILNDIALIWGQAT
jgi:hypothetical protein